uniref:Protein PsbN n=2 Tax=Palmophyllaceae TaxID=2201466 RepID=A0A161KK75_9VIRI|nr:N protein of photosystem II [Verdigellas peltata]YP_009340824.1 N protein of photosystem II [Palmophyllum crassum]BAW34771.1 N protein of photosystem II [Palmophyllum crassum]CZF96645.1 N protein of photosystem II [Verdigellas peltata]
METAILITIFLFCALFSLTSYSVYTAFGNPANDLRDPFDEHED